MVDIRKKQIVGLKQMLNLNEEESKIRASGPTWKILIYDKHGQDIISPLISVKELRELGVTIHVLLQSDRDAIPDVPAVYFVQPTDENVAHITKDFQSGKYDMYYLNFITSIPGPKLELLASAAFNNGSVEQVRKVHDQFLNFISLESDLFVLKHHTVDPVSYYSLNRPGITDREMDATVDQLVDGLFSVFACMNVVPFIYAPKHNAAEKVAEKLNFKLRDNLKDVKNCLFNPSVGSSFQKSLLIILDRDIDLATPLHHTWTYQALVHDVLDLNLNRVVVEEAAGGAGVGGARAKTKACHLDQSDKFWKIHKGSPFPTVAEAIQEELDECRKSEDEVKRLKKSMGLEADEAGEVAFSMVTDNTSRLTTAVNDLPQMLERKRLLDMHMTIAMTLLNSIKTRRLDNLFECEEKIMGRQALERTFAEILADHECGSSEDKLRLLLIYYMCSSNIPEAELTELCNILRDAGCDLSALSYLRRCKQVSQQQLGETKIHTDYSGISIRNKMFSTLLKGSALVMEGVKNLTIKKHNLPVTRTVDEILDQKTLDKGFVSFDPRQSGRSEKDYTVVVVFMVGGGNYIEYQNLVDYTKSKFGDKTNKRIIYGASSLNNASEFLRQITLLGREIQ